MRSQEFPTCCGIRLLTEFGNTYTATNSTAYTPEQVDTFLKQYDGGVYDSKALNMIVLNNEQKEVLGKTLYDNGYRLVRKKGYFHPGHRTYLYIYLREFYPETEVV